MWKWEISNFDQHFTDNFSEDKAEVKPHPFMTTIGKTQNSDLSTASKTDVDAANTVSGNAPRENGYVKSQENQQASTRSWSLGLTLFTAFIASAQAADGSNSYTLENYATLIFTEPPNVAKNSFDDTSVSGVLAEPHAITIKPSGPSCKLPPGTKVNVMTSDGATSWSVSPPVNGSIAIQTPSGQSIVVPSDTTAQIFNSDAPYSIYGLRSTINIPGTVQITNPTDPSLTMAVTNVEIDASGKTFTWRQVEPTTLILPDGSKASVPSGVNVVYEYRGNQVVHIIIEGGEIFGDQHLLMELRLIRMNDAQYTKVEYRRWAHVDSQSIENQTVLTPIDRESLNAKLSKTLKALTEVSFDARKIPDNCAVLLDDNSIQVSLPINPSGQLRTLRFANIRIMINFMKRLSELRYRLSTTRAGFAPNPLRLILDIDEGALIEDTSALEAVEKEIAALKREESRRRHDDDEPPTGTAGTTPGIRARLSAGTSNTVLRAIAPATATELGAAVSDVATGAWNYVTSWLDTIPPIAFGDTESGVSMPIPESPTSMNSLQRQTQEPSLKIDAASATTGVAKSATLAGEMSKAGIGGALFASLNTVMIYYGVDEESRLFYLGSAGIPMLAVGLRTDPVHTVAALVYAIPGTLVGAGAGHVTAEVLPVSEEAKTSIREAAPMLGGAASAGYGLYKTARSLATIAKTCAGVDGAVVAYPLFLVGASTHKFVTEDYPAMVAAHDDYVARKNEYRAEDDPFGEGFSADNDQTTDDGGEDGGVTADDDASGDAGSGDDSVAGEAVAIAR